MDQCPLCRYSLHGLPGAGRCPECGNPYSPEHILLRGELGQATQRRVGRNKQHWIFAGGAIFFAVQFLVFLLVLPGPVRVPHFIPLAASLIMAVLALAAWLAGGSLVAQTMVYLAPHGYGQGSPRRGIRNLHAWKPGLEIDFRPAGKRWHLSIRDGFAMHVAVWLDIPDDHCAQAREALARWQPARVNVVG